MSALTHAMVEGINAQLVHSGKIAWPDEKTASEVCYRVSESLQGPEILPEEGLSKTSTLLIARTLKTASERLIQAGQTTKEAVIQGQNKIASFQTVENLALSTASQCMEKAAAEALLIEPGTHQNTPEASAAADTVGLLELHNRPVGYAAGIQRGQTALPEPGHIGKTEPYAVQREHISGAPSLKAAEEKKTEGMPEHLRKALREADMVEKKDKKEDKKDKEEEKKASEKTAEELTKTIRRGLQKLSFLMARDAVLASVVPMGKTADLNQLTPEELHALAQAVEQYANPGGAQGVDLSQMDEPTLQALHSLGLSGEAEDKEEPAKAASLLERLKRAADGSLTEVGKNTPESAAKTDTVADLDKKNRGPAEYVVGQGKTEMPNVGHVGADKDPAKAPPKTGPDNAATRELNKSGSDLTPAEQDFVMHIEKMAQLYSAHLPTGISREEKIACLKKLAGMSPEEANSFLTSLRK